MRAENDYQSALEHLILLKQFSKRLPSKFKDILLNSQVLGTEKLSFKYLVEFVRQCLRRIKRSSDDWKSPYTKTISKTQAKAVSTAPLHVMNMELGGTMKTSVTDNIQK